MFTGYSEVARWAGAEAPGWWITGEKQRNKRPWHGRLSSFCYGAPWRGVLWTAVKRGHVQQCGGCVSSHPQSPPMGAKRSPMGVVHGVRRSFTSSSTLIPMPDGLATRCPWQFCDLSPELAAGAWSDTHTATLE